MKKFIDKLLEILYPSDIKCLDCGKDINKGEDFCIKCKKNLPFNNGNICKKCGTVLEKSGVCIRCAKRLNFKIARSPFMYDGIIKRLIHNFKYDNAKFLFKPLAKYMANCYKENNMKADVIVAIPLYKARFKKRGYNQAEKLSEEMSKIINLPLISALERIKDTPSQTNLDFKERQRNIEGAFTVKDKSFEGKNVLLIDDVYTSGATMKEASKVLKQNGAKDIYIITLAHTKLENKE